MTHFEIRDKFLKFFESKGHTRVSSSSLLPTDPSVLFTTAGMQQFKPYYTGEADPMKDFSSLNTVSIQKSMRTSDIDEVGDDTHLTFFEMLGNFSFGGYWKEEAIKWAHEFITKELELEISYVTIFRGSDAVPKDEESKKIWRGLGIAEENIREEGMDDVFWGPTGNQGPCGPTTEIYCKNTNSQDVEIWNIVFNEFMCDGSRKQLLAGEAHLSPLTKKGIDTGMGLDRLATIVEKKNIFETDLFVPLLTEIRGKNLYDYESNKKAERIIADHLRASIFLIADGVIPSNTAQGYILRRLLRRTIRYAKQLNLPEDIYERAVHVVGHDIYNDIYPELEEKKKIILEVILNEKNKFLKTLDRGLKEFEKIANNPTISGKEAFDLYQSYGFPIEMVEELAKEKGLSVDVSEFQKQITAHKMLSTAGAEKKFGGHGLVLDAGELKVGSAEELQKITRLHTATHLMNQALHNVLGEGIKQAGSDITTERTRFDFTFDRKVTPEELKKIEDEVNDKIREDLPVQMAEVPKEEATAGGARSFRPEKYPDVVKVYYVGTDKDWRKAYSKEFCGGPHVDRTGVIGRFKITKEESASAGIRRIRATVE
jgi:alanyl-tRNA synthetase